MNIFERRVGFAGSGLAAGILFALTASVTNAVDEAPEASAAEAPTAITPVSATKPAISFGRCHFQKTPPYEPRVRLECDAGEVVVAVFEDGIRCCELELR